MYTFLISIFVVAFVAYCFFKREFWENRYIVLLIGAGVAFVAILIVNYSVRNSLKTQVHVTSTMEIGKFSINNKVCVDTTETPIFEKLNFDDEDELLMNMDTLQISRNFLIYIKDKTPYVGFFKKNFSRYYYSLNDIYIVPMAASDTIPYMSNERLEYNADGNNWISEISLPYIAKRKVLHVPADEYMMIPDSLIRKLSF